MRKRLILYIISLIMIGNGCEKKQNDNALKENKKTIKLDKGSFGIDKNKSSIIWTGKQLSTKEHKGTLEIKKGDVFIDENGLIVGDIVINMLTINTTDIQGKGKDRLDGHLKSSDFFDVDQYPDAYLKFKSNDSQLSDGKLKLNGELEIKNHTHPINFYAELNQNNKSLIAKARIAFDRTKYDIRYGSGQFFENLGDRLILDEIIVDVVIVTI